MFNTVHGPTKYNFNQSKDKSNQMPAEDFWKAVNISTHPNILDNMRRITGKDHSLLLQRNAYIVGGKSHSV